MFELISFYEKAANGIGEVKQKNGMLRHSLGVNVKKKLNNNNNN